MPYSDYLKCRTLQLHAEGLSPTAIVDALALEGLLASRHGLEKFLSRVEQTGSLERRPGSNRPSKVTPQAMAIVEAQMQGDDETTATQLRALLSSKGSLQHCFVAVHLSGGPFVAVRTAK